MGQAGARVPTPHPRGSPSTVHASPRARPLRFSSRSVADTGLQASPRRPRVQNFWSWGKAPFPGLVNSHEVKLSIRPGIQRTRLPVERDPLPGFTRRPGNEGRDSPPPGLGPAQGRPFSLPLARVSASWEPNRDALLSRSPPSSQVLTRLLLL